MSITYTPHDIAVFLIASNFKHSEERVVIKNIWENENIPIFIIYQNDEAAFKHKIYFEITTFDNIHNDLDELNILLRNTEFSFFINGTINEQCVIESYFKIIKLELIYWKINYRKIKLRRLLDMFGYKRRSVKIVGSIRSILKILNLKTYLRGHVLCDIAKVGIDDMIIIRLNI